MQIVCLRLTLVGFAKLSVVERADYAGRPERKLSIHSRRAERHTSRHRYA